MALPKIDVPIYEIKLESQKNTIKFRPFTVKEEKLFLMVNESDDEQSMLNTVKQVLQNCVIGEINIDDLPSFDIEYLFLNLRARSIGELVNLRYNCNNFFKNESGEEKKCNGFNSYDINLLELKPEKEENHTSKIQLSDNLGVVMKYPTVEIIQRHSNDVEVDDIIELIADCIDFVYDKEEIYYAKDTSKKELKEWIEGLEISQLEKIKFFFDTMPKLKKTLDFKCPKCDYEEKINLEGIQSFFV